LGNGEMALEYAYQTLSRYDVSLSRGAARLEAVSNPRLSVTEYGTPQPNLFALDTLVEGGWLKALRLEGYATGAWRCPEPCNKRSSLTRKPSRSGLLCRP
jgi:hypothetical protein